MIVKSEHKKSLKAEIILTISKEDKNPLGNCLNDLKAVCCAKELKEGSFEVIFEDLST